MQPPVSFHAVTVHEVFVLQSARKVAEAEEEMAEEYLRHVVAGIPTWQAQKMSERKYLRAVQEARAWYDIAVSRLKRS